MLSPNTYLQNRYRIIRILGKGGMGQVYEAIDDAVECIVAIKETVADSDKLRRAFEREAKLLANLRHPALPRVTHHFFEGNRQFLVMDFIEGLNLAELLSLRKLPFTSEEILPWTDELLKALEYLHNRIEPVIHRDIKPANLKLTKDGQIYLLDFGLAKGTAGQMSAETGHLNSSIYGYTEAYASPEQINNTGTNGQSDLYSLGTTLYHLLTGQIPVSAPRRELKVARGKPDPLLPAHEVNPLIPQPLSLVLSRAMALDQADRFASASEMRQALQEARLAIETGRDMHVPAPEKISQAHEAGELAWQETQPPEAVASPPPAMSRSIGGSTLPAEKNKEVSRAELPTLSTQPPVLNELQIDRVDSSAEVSWPSQINSEAEDSPEAVSPSVEAQRREAREAAAQREAEEIRRQEAEAEDERLAAEATRLKREEEERLRREAEEANRRRAEEEERLRLEAERERLRAEEEARRRRAEEEAAALRRAEEDAARQRAAELAEAQARIQEERQRAADLLLAREEEQRREQEEARRKREEEEQGQAKLLEKTIPARQTSVEMLQETSAGSSVETDVSELRATMPPAPTMSARSEEPAVATDVARASTSLQTPARKSTVIKQRVVRPWLVGSIIAALLVVGVVIFALTYSSQRRNRYAWLTRQTPKVVVNTPEMRPGAQPLIMNLKQDLKGQRGVAWSVAFSPDGSVVASASEDKKVRLWDTQSWKLTRTLDGHEAGVNSVAFSPDGKMLASGSNDKTVRLWDAQNAYQSKTLNGHTDEVYFVAFSPDGRLLASAGKDRTIKLWDAQNGRELKTLKGHRDVVWSVAFSTDGKLLASASRDKTIKLWETESGKEVRTLNGHAKAVIAIAFSPDGQLLASGSDDKSIKLWKTGDWQESKTLNGHGGYITSIAFSPDSKLLASAGNDKTIQLWDIQTGESRQSLTGHAKGVNALSFSPDGKTLISGSKDETVKVWQ